MDEGTLSFEWEITQNLCNTNATPALFAIMHTWANSIKAAHGFEQMILSTNQHWADGHIGFFLGDQITIQLATRHNLQDPCLVTTQNFDRPVEMFTGIPASDQAITNSKAPLVSSSSHGHKIPLPKLFPIPPTRWTTFLHGATAPRDALKFINWTTHTWTSADGNIAGSAACLWACSTCTTLNHNPKSSLIAIHMTVDEGNVETGSTVGNAAPAHLPTCTLSTKH